MKLYLASQSPSRHKLLRLAGIPFEIVSHESDECSVPTNDDAGMYIATIAKDKMDHVTLPVDAREHKKVVVLTADTLVKLPSTGELFGKPTDREDAKRMLRLMRDETVDVVTACCFEVREWDGNDWQTVNEKAVVVTTLIDYCVPEDELDAYFDAEPGSMYAASGAVAEALGGRFLKRVVGSYSGVMGLPLFEVAQVLKSLA